MSFVRDDALRILLLAEEIPYPLDNGQRLRSFHLARQLSRRHELHLVAFGDCERDLACELAPIFRSIRTVPRRSATPLRPRRRLSTDPSGAFSVDMNSEVAEAVEHVDPDCVWAVGWETPMYLPRARPSLVDVIDNAALYHVRQFALRPHRRTLPTTVKAVLVLARFMRRYLRNAGVCVAISADDAHWMRVLCPRLPVEVVPNGVDTTYFRPLPIGEAHPTVVFEGAMSYPPNDDAVRYLCSDILPAIRRKIPNVDVTVVGKEPAVDLVRHGHAGVTFTGYVHDVRPYLAAASVFLCPLRAGTGVKNKILQAWAMAKPVVTTPLGCSGLAAIANWNVSVASGTQRLADATVALLQDEGRRREIGHNGRQTVDERYRWEIVAAAFERLVRRSVSVRPQPRDHRSMAAVALP